MSHHCPARSESKETNDIIKTLKARIRRLEKLLKEARRSPPDNDSEAEFGANEELPQPVPPQLSRPKQHPLSCACSRKDAEKVRQIDFISHILFVCSECNMSKTIKRKMT